MGVPVSALHWVFPDYQPVLPLTVVHPLRVFAVVELGRAACTEGLAGRYHPASFIVKPDIAAYQ